MSHKPATPAKDSTGTGLCEYKSPATRLVLPMPRSFRAPTSRSRFLSLMMVPRRCFCRFKSSSSIVSRLAGPQSRLGPSQPPAGSILGPPPTPAGSRLPPCGLPFPVLATVLLQVARAGLPVCPRRVRNLKPAARWPPAPGRLLLVPGERGRAPGGDAGSRTCAASARGPGHPQGPSKPRAPGRRPQPPLRHPER